MSTSNCWTVPLPTRRRRVLFLLISHRLIGHRFLRHGHGMSRPILRQTATLLLRRHQAQKKLLALGGIGTMCSHLPINKICFRNCRKRKALEINTNHMERKVMQRRSNPLVEYKSSQSSQETNVNVILKVELAPMDTKNDLTDDDEESSTSSGLSQGWSGRQLTKFNPTVGNGVYELASQEQYASSEDEDASSKDAYTSSKYEDASSKDEDASSKDENTSSKDEDAPSKDEDTSSKDEDASSEYEEVTREASNAFNFVIKKVESLKEFYDAPRELIQEPKVGKSDQNWDLILRTVLEDIKAVLIYSTERIEKAIQSYINKLAQK